MIASSNRNRHNPTADTKEGRLLAARRFVKSSRVRHRITGLVGSFVEMNYGFALPEVWVQFDSSTEIQVPTSCNPLDLERVNSESNQREKMPSSSELSEAKATPGSAVEVIEELTHEEADLRHRLELKVERAFYEAGKALTELRDRRLYRSTHKTFEQYCRERFGFQRAHSYRLIDAAGVVENLASIEMSPNRRQILPTKLEQIRSLTSLESDKQREVWLEAVERANGKVPTGATVKGIVERVKQQDNIPTQPEYSQGDVVEIRSGGSSSLRKYDGMWGIITHVGSWSYQVHISLRGVDIQCKAMDLERVDEKYTADIRAVSDRIIALCMRDDLATTALAVLEALARKTCFTPDDIWFLERVEERYQEKTSAK